MGICICFYCINEHTDASCNAASNQAHLTETLTELTLKSTVGGQITEQHIPAGVSHSFQTFGPGCSLLDVG